MSGTPRVRSGAFPQTPATVRMGGRGAPMTPSPSPPTPAGEKKPIFVSGRPSTAGRRSMSSSGRRSRRSSMDGIDDYDGYDSFGRFGGGSRRNSSFGRFGGGSRRNSSFGASPPRNGPVIPLDIIDAPTQRFYALAFYVGLLAWKGYDWVQLLEDNSGSFWLFLKWICIDFVLLFGLPELRIPWLELSQPVVVVLFLGHVVLDYVLMFNIGVPWHAWALGLIKVFYDRELSISEHYVKTSSILQNSSLISGRQIINILPEGSAVELVRRDLDTNEEEVLKLSRHQLREIAKLVRRHEQAQSDGSATTAVRYDVPVKKPGAYRLGRVLDEYKLDVQRPSPFSFVVACPSAQVGRSSSSSGGGGGTSGVSLKKQSSWSSSLTAASSAGPVTRCHGDLSNLLLEVHGTPPLKIVYSRTINGKDHSFHFQSLQPEGFSSPLLGTGGGVPSRSSSSSSSSSSSLDLLDFELAAVTANIPTEGDVDISWARARRVSVGLNETMHVGGEWQYSIDEVHDAFGNVAKYNEAADEQHDVRPRPSKHQLAQSFLVRERPRARLQGCDLRQPLKVARGRSTSLPVQYDMPGVRQADDGTEHTLTWQFSPIDSLTKSGDHGDGVVTQTYSARHADDLPTISAPGLYTLRSVSSDACQGEVQEPSSCLLLNPLEPKLALRSEGIPDSCGGQSVGLRVDLDLVGTPPFLVRYDVSTNGVVRHEKVQIANMRYQLELIPRVAGSHRYVFRSIDDAVYKAQPLVGADMVLEQNVKPAARATIDHPTGRASACLQEAVVADVVLSGEAPFVLEYVLLHEGKRRAFKAEHITTSRFRIETPALTEGGEYTLALTSVHDRSGCRTFLQDSGGELKIAVRRQRPRAAFGLIENRRRVQVVEGAPVKLPMRLTGEGPWRVSFRKVVEGSEVQTRSLASGNDFLSIGERGQYEIVDVFDNQCHGIVDPAAARFEVGWFPRPELSVVPTDAIRQQPDGLLVKQDVCEGDIDGFEIDLKASGSQSSLIHKQFDAALGRASLQMDTAKAGTYRYEFAPPADSLYNGGSGGKSVRTDALVLQQTVHAKPAAVFAKAGQSFKYCMAEEDNEERIPMVLTGVAPFYVEIEIKHQSGVVAETYGVPSIMTHTYGLQIPRQHLRPGTQQIRIRRVRDARGCQQKTDEVAAAVAATAAATTVQVQLFEAPAVYALESRTDYCVGERISYTLSGTAPFDVWYTFDGTARRGSSASTTFRRVAEAPGEFAITAVGDGASTCRASVNLTRTIHPLPWVRVSQGRTARSDIHEGGAVEMVFDFGGTPPFEFSYTRSTNARKGQRSQVLETRHDVSYEHRKVVRASQEGTYEVVAVKDKFCAFSTQRQEEVVRG
ncbi:nuclear envelope pore membrane protein [Grosmannia clavigera kw1407]|uniref:Nuclear envelope pore membrane protein n=1 Tax=Grosmannia clavigera (strain kw1407 / UAMH 11150) TaxID=655863 RepID=F0XR83_GROCL|nr:nuclear envelope pore membrane protein [Grosmannia clavigera kw1407]EFW99723.1 nuclear envelope pore membrane protein [Grosmannia clavigera kw1407]